MRTHTLYQWRHAPTAAAALAVLLAALTEPEPEYRDVRDADGQWDVEVRHYWDEPREESEVIDRAMDDDVQAPA